MKLAQNYLRDSASGEERGGFNARLQGETHQKCMDGMRPGSRWGQRSNGWDAANEMIKKGEIFSEMFSEKLGRCVEFKCMRDGNVWLCVGPKFVNLQEPDCYAFGDSREKAINGFIGNIKSKEETVK